MADQAQDRGGEAEAGDGFGGNAGEAARGHRVAGPDHGSQEGGKVAEGIVAIERQRLAGRHQKRRAGEAEDDTGKVVGAQTLTG